MVYQAKRRGRVFRQIRTLKFWDVMGASIDRKVRIAVSTLTRKTSSKQISDRTVNRHRWVSRVYSGVEITFIKELGKITP